MRRIWLAIILSTVLAVSAAGAASAQGAGLVDMEFEGARLADVLRVLGELGGYNVMVDDDVQSNVSFRLQGMSVDEAIEMVIRTSGYSYRQMGNTLVVGAEQTLRARFDTVESKLLRLEYADPAAILPVLRLLLPGIEAQADVGQRALVVRGTAHELARAEQLVRERDIRPRVDQEFVDTPIVEILRALARFGGYNLVAQGEIVGTMTVVLQGRSVEDAIDLVAGRAGLTYEIDDADLFVYGIAPELDDDDDDAGARPISSLQASERRLVQLVHISPSKIADAVIVLAAGGEVWTDEDSRTMIITAGASALRQIDELVTLLDVPALAVRGILRQGDEHVAIVDIDRDSYIVRAGDRVAAVKVVAVDADGVSVETAHGRRLSVPAGGK